jgi:hypothetical protein
MELAMKIKRGDIVWVNLDPTIGDEAAALDNRSLLETNKTALI